MAKPNDQCIPLHHFCQRCGESLDRCACPGNPLNEESKDKRIVALKAERDEAVLFKREADHTRDTKWAEVERLKSQVAKLCEGLSNAHDTNRGCQDRIGELNKDLGDVGDQLSKAHRDVRAAEAKVERLTGERDEALRLVDVKHGMWQREFDAHSEIQVREAQAEAQVERLTKALREIHDECEPSEWGDVLRICGAALDGGERADNAEAENAKLSTPGSEPGGNTYSPPAEQAEGGGDE